MEDETGWNDVDDAVVDRWTKRLIEEKKPIWFEELYNQDVAARATEKDAAPIPPAIEPHAVEPPAVDSHAVENFLGVESRLKRMFGDGLKDMNKKLNDINERLDGMDTRIKSVEAFVNLVRGEGQCSMDFTNEVNENVVETNDGEGSEKNGGSEGGGNEMGKGGDGGGSEMGNGGEVGGNENLVETNECGGGEGQREVSPTKTDLPSEKMQVGKK